MKPALLVFLGGGVGSVLRYLGVLALQPFASVFPLGTFCVNILGSFLIGVMGFLLERDLAFTGARHLLVVGLLGGFTTFSAFSFESAELLKAGNYSIATTYILGSVGLCLLATILGLWFTKLAFA